MKSRIAVLLFAVVTLAATAAFAGTKNPVVGGKEMYPTTDIIDNAVNSTDHTTLVAAVKSAGLVDTLKGAGRSRFSLPPMNHSQNCVQAQLRTC